MQILILDTNVVLDLFVFNDKAARQLRADLEQGGLHWIATRAMRDELERVLAYPHIESRMTFYGLAAADVLAGFDHHAHLVDAPAKASVACSDPDDQKFIDLAVHRRCLLLSKDAAVLSMKKRLAALEVVAAATMPDSSCMLSQP
jgi:predicted nucleic acid-binding protein